MFTYLEIRSFIFLDNDMGQSLLSNLVQVTSMHTWEHPALTGKGFHSSISLVTDSPWCFKALLWFWPTHWLTGKIKKKKLLNPGQPALSHLCRNSATLELSSPFIIISIFSYHLSIGWSKSQHGPNIIYSPSCCLLSYTYTHYSPSGL